MTSAGYSTRSLAEKLGLKAGMQVAFLHAPEGYFALLGPIFETLAIVPQAQGSLDFVHYFSTSRAAYTDDFPALKASLAQNGMLWVSWPKKAAKVPTDLDENVIRDIGLAGGLVDVKVAAIDATWSGLKFVYRVVDRTPQP